GGGNKVVHRIAGGIARLVREWHVFENRLRDGAHAVGGDHGAGEGLAHTGRIHGQRIEDLDREFHQLTVDEISGEGLTEIALALELSRHGSNAAGARVLVARSVEREEEERLLPAVVYLRNPDGAAERAAVLVEVDGGLGGAG